MDNLDASNPGMLAAAACSCLPLVGKEQHPHASAS